jgi:hypothetical protein
VAKRQADRAECDLLPGHAAFLDHRDLQAFFARLELEIEEPGTVEHVHLVDARDGDQTEGCLERDACAGFLQRLSDRRLSHRLVVLHEARGERPVAIARLDRAAAKENPPRVLRDRADDQLGVLVMDLAAGVADVARQAVAGRHAPRDRGTAVGAELHGQIGTVPI